MNTLRFKNAAVFFLIPAGLGFGMNESVAFAARGKRPLPAVLKPIELPRISSRKKLQEAARQTREAATLEASALETASRLATEASSAAHESERAANLKETELRETRGRLQRALDAQTEVTSKLGAATARKEAAAVRLATSARASRPGFFKLLGGAIASFLGSHDGAAKIEHLAASVKAVAESDRALKAITQKRDESESEIRVVTPLLAGLEDLAPAARKAANESRRLATDLQASAREAETRAQAALQLAERSEAAHAPVQKAYFQRVALANQHLLRNGNQQKTRSRYRSAVSETGTAFFSVSKPGKASQDGFSVAPELKRFAISDGVTRDTNFSGENAQELTAAWTSHPPRDLTELPVWLENVQATWSQRVAPLIAERKSKPWNQGTTEWVGKSTFVGGELRPIPNSANSLLRVMGLGDSVIFHVRAGELVRAWPKTQAKDFESLDARGNDRDVESLRTDGPPAYLVSEASWEVKPGDELFLATDALAEWTFFELEAGHQPFELLNTIEDSNEMNEFVVAARRGKIPGSAQMAVDDTTLVRMTVPPHPSLLPLNPQTELQPNRSPP